MGSGEVVCERSAAAAAADDRDADEAELLRKADVAAMAAEELGLVFGGCVVECQFLIPWRLAD